MLPIYGEEQGASYIYDDPSAVIPEEELNRREVLTTVVAGPQVGQAVRQEMITSGQSQTQDRLLQEFKRQQTITLKNKMEEVVVNPEIPTEEKISTIKTMDEQTKAEGFGPSIIDIAKQNFLATNKANDINAQQLQDGIVDNLHNLAKVDEQIAKLPLMFTFPQDVANQVVDATVGVLSPWWDQNIKDALNYAVPGFVSPTERLPWPLSSGAGDLIQRWNDHLNNLSPEEKLNTVRRLAEGIEQNSVYWSENGYAKMELWRTLVQDLDQESQNRVMNNIWGALDYVGLGLIKGTGVVGSKLAKRVIKGKAIESTVDTIIKDADLKKIEKEIVNTGENKPASSVAAVIEQVAPEQARAAQVDAIADPTGRTAAALGATREQITNDGMLPKQPGMPVPITPSLHDINDTIIDIDLGRSYFTERELAAAEGATDVRIDALVTVSPHVHLHKMETDIIPNGYTANYHIYDSGTRGFSTLKLAERTAKTFKQFSDSSTAIMVKKYDSDEFVPLSEARTGGWYKPKGKNEYAIRLSVTENLTANNALDEVPIFTGNNTVGKLAAWHDKSATFVKWLVNAGNMAVDVKSGKLGAFVRIIKPLTDLKEKDQSKIIRMLDEGDRAKRWWSDTELAAAWQDAPNLQDLIAGYRSVLRHNQSVYTELNKRARSRLAAEGYKHVILPQNIFGDNFSNMAKFVGRHELKTTAVDDLHAATHSPRDIKKIYDATNKKILDVTPEQLDALHAIEGNKFMKLHTPAWADKQQFQYMVIRDGKGPKIKELPKNVIRNEPGYISRVYDDPYILKQEKGGMTDGYFQSRLAAVRMYATEGEMLRDMERLNLEEEGKKLADPKYKPKKYLPTRARELQRDMEYASRSSLEYLEDSGMLFTSRRGKEILGVDGARSLKSISNSLEVMRNRAAAANTLEPLIDKLVVNWEKKYGKLFSEDGKMPWDTTSIKNISNDIRKTKAFNEAVAFQRHIKLIAGVDDSVVNHAMRNFMVQFSEYLSTNWNNTWINKLVAEPLVKHRRANPINAVKSAAFTHYIIFNPIRQLALQAQQWNLYLGLDNAIPYFLGGGIREYGSLVGGTVFRHTKLWGEMRTKFARMAGMSEKEYERLVDGYQKTGLPSSVDHHMYSVVSNLERTHVGDPKSLGMITQIETPLKLWRNTKKVFRRAGFDAGEHAQLQAGFLAVRNKWMKANPRKAHLWDSPENLAEIGAQTRAVSLNMNEAGTLESQRGLWGLIFQFMSHATKSFQVLIPNTEKAGSLLGLSKFSNKAFSNAEKARIFATQTVMYGTGAFGVNQLFEKMLEETNTKADPEFIRLVEEGINGSLLNLAFGAMADEEGSTNLELSTTMATFSGIGGRSQIVGMGNPVGWLINGLFLSDMTLAEALGPAVGLGGKISEGLALTGAILGAVPAEELGTPEMTVILDEWARELMPMYNNFVRGRLEDLYDRHVSSSGNIGTEVSDGETWGKFWIGANSRLQREVNRDLIEIRGLMGNPKETALKAELNETGDLLYKYIKRTVENVSEEKYDYKMALDSIKRNAVVFKAAFEPDEYRYVMNRIRESYIKDMSGDTLENQLLNNLMNISGQLPSLFDEDYMTKIHNTPDFENKDRILNWLESMKQ